MTAEPVLFEMATEHVARVTIHRPQVRNAINGDVAEALESVVFRTEQDAAIRAIVLTGAGDGIFSAGADLREVASGGLARIIRPTTGFAGFVDAERNKPWIAAVEGPALAGGCEIALACDLIVASTASSFGLPNVTRGLTAWAGGLYRLPQRLPRAIALEAILTGRPIDASSAAAFGLVNALTDPGEALAHAIDLACSIAAHAPLAVRESLAIARRAHELDDATLRAMSDESRARITRSEDFHEGVRAFNEKRKPAWTGR